ncbi:MAG: thioredoxin family protein [Candidatus Ozemobacteraceae bacterium]
MKMKRSIFSLLFAITVLLTVWAPPVTALEDGWLTSVEDGLKEIQGSPKRVLIYFTADWCKYCTQEQAAVFDQEEFKEYADKNLVLISIDADKNADLVKKFRVEGYPTFFLLDPNGGIVVRMAGYIPFNRMMRILKRSEGATAKESGPIKPAGAAEAKEGRAAK